MFCRAQKTKTAEKRIKKHAIIGVFERVDKVDTFKEKTSYARILFENKGLRSHGAHRASPCNEPKIRHMS